MARSHSDPSGIAHELSGEEVLPALTRSIADDHDVWVVKDKHHRGWIACFSVKAGHIEYVRDNGLICLFSDFQSAERAGFRAHLNRQNIPRSCVKTGVVHGVTGTGRTRIVTPVTRQGKRHV